MNITEAIAAFEARGHRKFPTSDVNRITSVAAELGFTEFSVKEDFITDMGNVLHIHLTMIVSGIPYSGSTDRGPAPYPKYPHHLELEGWSDSSKSEAWTNKWITCPDNHNPFPITSECECGWKPAKA